MQGTDRALQVLGIPYSALMSIVFGMMVVSFPLGAYLFFSDTGQSITHEYPLEHVGTVFSPVFALLPFEADLGDGFAVVWSVFAILFAVGMLGPRQYFVKAMVLILSAGRNPSSSYIVSVLKWFGVLVVASVIIDTVQGSIGVSIEPPDFGSDLIQFFYASLAPLVEEVGFRVILVGLPLYAMFYRRTTPAGFVRSLWHPFYNLDAPDIRRVLALIASAGILFGLAHILFGEPWSAGKFAQAATGGVILGWVYYRHGLPAAILLHWATNYFVFSYVYLVAFLNDITVQEASSHPLLGTFELVFVVHGAVSLAFVLTNYIVSRSQPRPQA